MGAALGRRLRILRRRRGLSQAIVANRVGHSERWLRDVETGAVDLWVADSVRLAEILGVDAADLVRGPVAPPTWWRGLPDRVSAAARPAEIATVQPDVARLVQMLDSERLRAALGRSSKVDRRLVESMSFVARQLPRNWGDLPYRIMRQLVHTQLLAFQALLSEPLSGSLRRDMEAAAAATAAFAGQVSIFGGKREDALRYLGLATRLARRGGDAETQALSLMFTSHLHSDAFLGGQRDANQREARELLEAADRILGPSTAAIARAWVLLCRAEELAGSDEFAAWRLVEEAERLYSAGGVPADGICCHWGPHLLVTYRGHVALVSDHPGQAVPLLESALSALRPGALMTRSAARADLSRAYSRLGEIDLACDLLGQAFDLAQQAGLTGPVAAIRRVRSSDLGSHATEPAVRRLDERISAMA